MSDFNVATRYAKALLETALETDRFDAISADVDYVLKAISDVRELKVAINSPVIKLEKKIQILEAIFKDKISEKTLEFLIFILNKNRAVLLSSILNRYCQLRDNKKGIASIKVKVAYDISEAEKQKLKRKLTELTQKQVDLNFQKDESIIGGFVAKHDDIVYDASIKHSLEQLKKQFINGDIGIN